MYDDKTKEIIRYLESNAGAHTEMPDLDGRLNRQDEPKDILGDWLKSKMGCEAATYATPTIRRSATSQGRKCQEELVRKQ